MHNYIRQCCGCESTIPINCYNCENHFASDLLVIELKSLIISYYILYSLPYRKCESIFYRLGLNKNDEIFISFEMQKFHLFTCENKQ